MTPHPTPYPDVNEALNRLLSDVQLALKNHFVGLYLYGSLASGDFDPGRSDVDFVIITDGNFPDGTVQALDAMHARIAASGLKWAAKLEGAYVPLNTLRRHAPDGRPCPTLNEGRFYSATLGSDWVIQRHIIRECGIVVAGPEPRPLIDPVQPDDLRWAVQAILREWWAPMLTNPAWVRGREYQAFAVQTMCRALYTLEHGEIVSKPAAARWARARVGARWGTLIDQALAWPREPHPDSLTETLEFIRYTMERSQEYAIGVQNSFYHE